MRVIPVIWWASYHTSSARGRDRSGRWRRIPRYEPWVRTVPVLGDVLKPDPHPRWGHRFEPIWWRVRDIYADADAFAVGRLEVVVEYEHVEPSERGFRLSYGPCRSRRLGTCTLVRPPIPVFIT